MFLPVSTTNRPEPRTLINTHSPKAQTLFCEIPKPHNPKALDPKSFGDGALQIGSGKATPGTSQPPRHNTPPAPIFDGSNKQRVRRFSYQKAFKSQQLRACLNPRITQTASYISLLCSSASDLDTNLPPPPGWLKKAPGSRQFL